MKRILVVDDSACVRQQVAFTLKQAGYEIVEAVDGADGLRKILGGDVAMAICDVNMHTVCMHSCEIDGDLAHAESYVIGLFADKGAETSRMIAGRYLDVYERRDGRWAIVHRREVVDWTRSDPAADDWFDRTPAALRGGRKGNDPSDIIGESHGPI